MPLPWKKAKGKRISQFVADHLHSPSRGGSLVVETGFPTSLVDLFVKNRERLKKPTKKNRHQTAATPDPISISVPPRTSIPNVTSSNSSTLATPPSSRPPISPLVAPSPPLPVSEYVSPQRSRNESFVVEEIGVGGKGEGNGEELDANRVFLAILRMFLVVVLAFWTKKFVVGITMSAFLLLLIEYAGKHWRRILESCGDAQNSVQHLIKRVLCFVRIKRQEEQGRSLKVPIVEETTRATSGRSVQVIQFVDHSSKVNDSFRDILIVPPSPDLVPPTREIQRVEYEFDLRSGKEKWVGEGIGKKEEEEIMEKEEAYTSEVLDVKSRRSRSGKIRSKIKKLMATNMHGSKKKKQIASKNEASSSSSGSKDEASSGSSGCSKVLCIGKEKGGHVEDDQQCELQSDDYSASELDIEDVDDIPREVSLANTEDSLVRENGERETGRKSGYLVIFGIVLVGLVAGRAYALALILSWFLLQMSAGFLRRFIEGVPDNVSITR